jgi:hypothetical protein
MKGVMDRFGNHVFATKSGQAYDESPEVRAISIAPLPRQEVMFDVFVHAVPEFERTLTTRHIDHHCAGVSGDQQCYVVPVRQATQAINALVDRSAELAQDGNGIVAVEPEVANAAREAIQERTVGSFQRKEGEGGVPQRR